MINWKNSVPTLAEVEGEDAEEESKRTSDKSLFAICLYARFHSYYDFVISPKESAGQDSVTDTLTMCDRPLALTQIESIHVEILRDLSDNIANYKS